MMARTKRVKRTIGGLKQSRTQEHLELLKRIFPDGMEVVEAKANIYLHTASIDEKEAVPHDLEKCVFAQCAHRQLGSTRMVFMQHLAYVDLEDVDGVRKVFRFRQSDGLSRAVIEYDKSNGKIFRHGTYMLCAIPESMSLDRIRQYNQEYRSDPVRRAEIYKSNKKSRYRSKAIIKMTGAIKT